MKKGILILILSILILVLGIVFKNQYEIYQNNQHQEEPLKKTKSVKETSNTVSKESHSTNEAEEITQAEENAHQEESTPQIEAQEETPKSSLSGKIISIDAGHQAHGNSQKEPVAPGSTTTKAKVSSGTSGVVTGVPEYVLNLQVALKLRDALEAKGATVYMVREVNEVDISNAQRAQMANEVNADLSLRIHADGSENSKVNGFSLLVPGNTYMQPEQVQKSRQCAEALEEALIRNIPNPSNGIVIRDDLTGFNWSKVPAVLLEMGFMSNPEEDQRMQTEAFQDALTQGVVEGLEAYFAALE